jgi:hypothetical protein
MHAPSCLAAFLLLALLSLAGCTGNEASTTSTSGTHATHTAGTTTSATTPTPQPVRHASLGADIVNGTAPLNITFGVAATGTGTNATWRLAFGDGQDANGTAAQLPANRTHAYLIGGNFTARLTVFFGDDTAVNATLNLTVHAPAGADFPKVFTFGASRIGCVGDAYGQDHVLNCINFQAGPGSAQVDGFWQALDERYTGQSFTSTIATSNPLPDSDCYFVAADATTITGDCTNGGSPAAGTVPAGTAWMFIYPYATPSSSIIVTFA